MSKNRETDELRSIFLLLMNLTSVTLTHIAVTFIASPLFGHDLLISITTNHIEGASHMRVNV